MPRKTKKKKRRMTGEAVIFDLDGRVLLVQQGKKRGGRWELPGGKVKKRESLPDAVVREVKEETGLDVTPERLLGIFFIRSQNRYDFIVQCRLTEDLAKPRACPPEIIATKFFSIERLPKTIRGFTLDRIADAREGKIYPLPVEISSEEWV